MTASDEPEARRRARIRLELAASYFGQGQDTVALDEIKLSLLADPTYADAHALRGLVYSRMNELGLAETSFHRARQLNPFDLRAYLGDGNYAGVYQRSDEEMLALWQIGVEETRAVIEEGWM